MKKSASAPPVSVRFLNSCSEDPAGSGDEGLGDDRAATEDAAGDGRQKVAPPPEPAAPAPAPASAPATAGQPVPPPRKHSVRSRADGLRDALQDLSPVKELVSRLGKSRSSSLDGTGPATAAAAAADSKTADQRAASDSDAWSRLTELTGKITKTVEGKISDYRGSVRSAGAGGGGGGGGSSASLSDTELLTESDVLESVRDASPSPPPPSSVPPPPTAADSLDVAFVNVPSPVSAPTASPTRRDFTLASIRPQIFERLQRSVGRPAAGTATPPATPPPPAPPESVTLSALQDKYIDEEGVDVAEEALEAPPPPPPEDAPQRLYSRTESGASLGAPAAVERAAPAPAAAAAESTAASLLRVVSDRVSTGARGGWRWLAAALAVLLAAPLPSFLSGLLLGVALAAAVGAALLPLLRPPARRLPPPPLLTSRRPPVKEYQPALMHKDWMHELTAGPYEPASHQPTEARFVRLEGSMLRLSHPKGHVSKRATWNEHIPSLPFVQQRIYDIAGCRVDLEPDGLHYSRRWNRRYPLCVRLDNCRRVTRSIGLLGSGSQKAGGSSDRQKTSDGEWEPGSEESSVDGVPPPPAGPRTLFLFARTDRAKEQWFRLLQEATRRGEGEGPSPAPEPPASEPASPAPATTAGSGSGSGSAQQESEDGSQPPPPPPEPSPKLDFDYYMSKLISVTPEDGSDSRPPSPNDGHGAAPPTTGHVVWFNALIGRLAFDVFGSRQWATFVQSRVQGKLSRIKLPYFIEELEVTSCDLGSVVPCITSVSAPSCDERGLWTDMAVVYEGGACVTLRTKVNLMKLRKSDKEQQQQQAADGGGSGSEREPSSGSAEDAKSADKCAAYACDRNDELADVESSSDEETETFSAGSDGGSPPPSAATASPSAAAASQSSSSVGKRLLKVVDKVTTSRYFQQAAQNRYVKRYMEEFSNTPLELTVTLRHLQGLLTLNIPRPPSDRLWYGFRGQPDILLSAQPRLGTRDVTLTQVTDWIENKLIGEVHKLLVLPNMDDLIVPLLAGETLDSL